MSVFNVIIKIFLIKTIGFYGEETATRFCIIVIVGFSNRKSMPSTVPLTIFWGDEIGTIGIIMLSCVYVEVTNRRVLAGSEATSGTIHLCDAWACRSNLCELESASWTRY